MIEEGFEGKLVLYFVDDRKTVTLAPLVLKHIAPGSIVHTDGWSAYESIPWNDFHLTRLKHIHDG